MYSLLYYALSFALAGATGMAIANRKATKQVSRQRWLKYFVYVLITAILLISLSFHFFFGIALIIAFFCLIEMVKNNFRVYDRISLVIIIPLLLFLLVAAGFVSYARVFQQNFLLFIYFQVFIFDGFCQVTGQIWGKRPLASSISPTKTVEGFMGGWSFCIIASMLGAGWINVPLMQGALFGLLTGFTACCGDLLASFYKRKLGIKDYSNWLPGQGGFLDRFDSLLFTGFIYYILAGCFSNFLIKS